MYQVQARVDSKNMAGQDVSQVQNLLLANSEGEEVKACLGCGKTFPLTAEYFYPRKTKQGFYSYCIPCHKLSVSKTYKENTGEIRKRQKKRYMENRETILLKDKERRKRLQGLDPEAYKNKRHEEYIKNRTTILAFDKIYHQRHKEKRNTYNREYYNLNKRELNEKGRLYLIKRRKRDDQYRMFVNLRRRMTAAMQENYKRGKMIDLLECSIDNLKKHLENKFSPGMTWGNYGRMGWHIDHILPCSIFNLSDPNQQKECFNYKNLQPLWWNENLKKGNNQQWEKRNVEQN